MTGDTTQHVVVEQTLHGPITCEESFLGSTYRSRNTVVEDHNCWRQITCTTISVAPSRVRKSKYHVTHMCLTKTVNLFWLMSRLETNTRLKFASLDVAIQDFMISCRTFATTSQRPTTCRGRKRKPNSVSFSYRMLKEDPKVEPVCLKGLH